MEEYDSLNRKKNNDYACEMTWQKKCIHIWDEVLKANTESFTGWKQQHYLMLPSAIEKDEKF